MTRSIFMWCTITIKHSMRIVPENEIKGCRPLNQSPKFRVQKYNQKDYPYSVTAASLGRIRKLEEMGALVQDQTELYENRVVLFYSIGPSFMNGVEQYA